MLNIIRLLLITLLFTSCEKVVDLKYKDNQSGIVIEGNITNQSGSCIVKISRSVGLITTGAYPTIDNAIVTISDDAGHSAVLAAQGNGTYSAAALTGVAGRTYTLTVQAENQTYVAQSTMPAPVPFDSIKVEEVAGPGGDKEYNLIPVYTDAAIRGNHYRFVLYLNGKLVNQHFIQDDVVRNGALNTFRLELNNDNFTLKPGDAVSLTMQCVDDRVALYYKTLALMSDSGPGGGTTPNNPPNNMSNGALGLFSAHTVETKMVILR